MPKIVLSSLALLLVGSVLIAAPQKRMAQKKPADFPTLISEAGSAWNEGKYGTCMNHLQEALKLVNIKRTEAILAALPTAPQGWKADADKAVEDMQSNPFANMMSAIGNVITRTYRQESGRGRIQVTVTADSPLVSMFQMWIANPAMLEKGAELIEYNEDKAVLKAQSGGLNLQILISGKHIVEVQAGTLTEDELFRMFSQETVDKIKAALSN